MEIWHDAKTIGRGTKVCRLYML